MTKRGLVLTISDVLFESGKATLLSGASRAIDKLSEFLIENPKRAILIEGHTDNIGSSTYNIDLSLRRAEAVASALEKRGIESFRVTKRGYGEEFPVTTNSTPEGRQQNRRVEVIIINEGIDPNSVLR
jgi:outer membrane protein OmpA-like peptidoglycan-associated protein